MTLMVFLAISKIDCFQVNFTELIDLGVNYPGYRDMMRVSSAFSNATEQNFISYLTPKMGHRICTTALVHRFDLEPLDAENVELLNAMEREEKDFSKSGPLP